MIKRIISAACAVVIAATGASLCARRNDTPKEPETSTTAEYTITGAYYSVSHNEYNEICAVVMAEAGGEPYAGQMAVAQVILNTCKIEHKRPSEVIADHGYSTKRPAPTKSVMDAVDEVFYSGQKVIDERVTMFYAPKVAKGHYSDDHEKQIYADTIGGHRFFIERKYA